MVLLLGTTILGAVSVALAGSDDTSSAGPWQDLLRWDAGVRACACVLRGAQGVWVMVLHVCMRQVTVR